MNIDEISSAISVMRMQEETAYKCESYLRQEAGRSRPVDATCRFKMIQWCYQIVDFCNFSRETVSISTSYLDRFLLTSSGREASLSRDCYQLAAMACLYTAVKLHEPRAMDPTLVAGLSRGAYTEKQITDMELIILNSLSWRVNPPTSMAFVRLFISLMRSSSITPLVHEEVFQCAGYQTELALSDCYFVATNPSTIALASVANALEDDKELQLPVKTFYLNIICNAASIDRNSPEVKNAKEKLRSFISKKSASNCIATSGSSPTIMASTKPLERGDSWKVSPRSVADEQ